VIFLMKSPFSLRPLSTLNQLLLDFHETYMTTPYFLHTFLSKKINSPSSINLLFVDVSVHLCIPFSTFEPVFTNLGMDIMQLEFTPASCFLNCFDQTTI
jgi:hypothetical protein